jgi:hypothetical protein
MKMSFYSLLSLLLLFTASAAYAEPAPPLPPATLQEAQAELAPLGGVRFRKFGFHVYDANLWASAGKWSWQSPFALDIRYARTIKGGALAQECGRNGTHQYRR